MPTGADVQFADKKSNAYTIVSRVDEMQFHCYETDRQRDRQTNRQR